MYVTLDCRQESDAAVPDGLPESLQKYNLTQRKQLQSTQYLQLLYPKRFVFLVSPTK